MFSRKSKARAAQRDVARGADSVTEFAERAVGAAATAAKEARRAATPVVRKTAQTAAETLSDTAEKLADAAERLAHSDAGLAARERLADTADAVAASVRPKPKKKHRVRKLLVLGAIVGGIVGLVKSPLPGKLADKLFGAPPDDDEFDTITLPNDDSEAMEPTGEQSTAEHETQPAGEDSSGH